MLALPLVLSRYGMFNINKRLYLNCNSSINSHETFKFNINKRLYLNIIKSNQDNNFTKFNINKRLYLNEIMYLDCLESNSV